MSTNESGGAERTDATDDPSAPIETPPPPPGAARRPALDLLVLLVVVAAVHLFLRAQLELPVLWGDEEHYLGYAMLDAKEGETSLLPGTLLFDHRPEFAARVFAQIADPSDGERTFRRIEGLQIALLLILVALTWIQARVLALGRAASSAAAALVGLFPWLAFHAHALWPELLHGVLFGTALLGLTLHQRTRNASWLVPAGIALGFALLTKGTLVPAVPIVVAFVVVRSPSQRWLAGALFAGALGLVLVPQLVRNASDGNGVRLTANRWWNLELGLTDLGELDPERLAEAKRDGLADGMERWLPTIRTSLAYFAAAETPLERERLAREPTLDHIRSRGVLGAAWDQIPKYLAVVFRPEPSFEQSVTYRRRFGDTAPAWLRALVLPSRLIWYALLALASIPAVAVATGRRRDGTWQLVLLFVAYVFAALLLAPVKFRFLLPVLPLLALLAVAGASHVGARLRSSRGARVPRG